MGSGSDYGSSNPISSYSVAHPSSHHPNEVAQVITLTLLHVGPVGVCLVM